MRSEQFVYQGLDALPIHTYAWLGDEGAPQAIVQIVHGMAEHAGRYAELAEFLTARGFAVYADDHRGHGRTANGVDNIGFFAAKDGWETVLADIHGLTREIKARHPGLPVFMVSHSMGSILGRHLLMVHGTEFSGAVFSGTAYDPGLLGLIGRGIAAVETALRGPEARSHLLNFMTFAPYNARCKPRRTRFDWLSRDAHEVDQYMNDPFCGQVSSVSFFADMLRGLTVINSYDYYAKIPKDIPLLFVTGSADPVTGYEQGVSKIVGKLKAAGCRDVEHKVYLGGRHEMFHETNRLEVYQDLVTWMTTKLPS